MQSREMYISLLIETRLKQNNKGENDLNLTFHRPIAVRVRCPSTLLYLTEMGVSVQSIAYIAYTRSCQTLKMKVQKIKCGPFIRSGLCVAVKM